MIVKELIKELQKLEQYRKVLIASDEEWNTLFKGVEIEIDGESKDIVLFGLSGTERD